MNTDFKPNSPTIVLAFSSLLLLTIGGPILWAGANGAHWTSVPLWAYPTMYAGSGLFVVGYMLFVATLVSAFVTIAIRAKRSSHVDAGSSVE